MCFYINIYSRTVLMVVLYILYAIYYTVYTVYISPANPIRFVFLISNSPLQIWLCSYNGDPYEQGRGRPVVWSPNRWQSLAIMGCSNLVFLPVSPVTAVPPTLCGQWIRVYRGRWVVPYLILTSRIVILITLCWSPLKKKIFLLLWELYCWYNSSCRVCVVVTTGARFASRL